MREEDPKWTVWLHRSRGTDSRSLRFDPRLAAAAAGIGLLLVALVGAAIGVLVERRAEAERVRELEARVEGLRDRQRGLRALAARLDSVERAYSRMREILGADAGAGAALELPPSAVGGDVPPGVTAGSGRLPAGWPLARPGFVTRHFRSGPDVGEHPGLDVAVPTGSYVRAVAPGTVEETGRDSVYGRYVRLAHDDGARSLYGHASYVFVQAGDSVEGGQVIALSGNSGRSTAPHLHVEVRRRGNPVDPLRFFRSRGAGTGSVGSSG